MRRLIILLLCSLALLAAAPVTQFIIFNETRAIDPVIEGQTTVIVQNPAQVAAYCPGIWTTVNHLGYTIYYNFSIDRG